MSLSELFEKIKGLFSSGSKKSSLTKFGSKPLFLYGRVNWIWFADNQDENAAMKLIEKELNLLVDNGWDGIIFETAGNSSLKVMSSPDKLERVKRMYKKTLDLCRKKNLWLFHSGIGNDNMGSKDGLKIYISTVFEQFKSLIDFIAAQGSKNVIVNVVSEIQTTGGSKLEQYGFNKLKPLGFKILFNGSGQPSSIPSGYDGISYHPASIEISKKCGKNCAVVPDHSRTLAELNNVDRLRKWLSDMKSKDILICSVYDYQQKTLNEPFIKALK